MTESPDALSLTTAEDQETFWVIADRVRFLGSLPGAAVVVAEVVVPPGAGTPLHSHASPELFRVLSGAFDFLGLEDGRPTARRAGPGDVLRVPPHVPHGYRNAGQTPATLLAVLDQAMAAFFRDLGAPTPMQGPPGPDDMARIGAACARHGIAFVPMAEAA